MSPHRFPLLAAATAAAAVLAGCGSGSSPSSAGGHLPSARFQQDALNYTTCVRSHGVPNLADPGTPGWKTALGSQAPAVLAAERTCGRLVPGVGPSSQSQSQPESPRQIAAMLAFAGCVRNHVSSHASSPDNDRDRPLAQACGDGHDP
ncbi:MAG: hypothetical protein ABSH51_20665 [Solirubrobacteraceae bacterium]|jgi:hypothetical protein